MKITVYGRGNVGGGLADLWELAGHHVTRLGREGGDVSQADVVLLAIPGGAVGEGLGKLRGLEGKTVVDATNRFGVEPPAGFASNAEFVKAQTNGPTAKSFSLNFAPALRRAGTDPRTPRQPVVRRRRGGRGRRTTRPRSRIRPYPDRHARNGRSAGGDDAGDVDGQRGTGALLLQSRITRSAVKQALVRPPA